MSRDQRHVFALFKKPSGTVVELRGQVSEDLSGRLATEAFMAIVHVPVKSATRSVGIVPMIVHSALTSRNSFQPKVARLWVTEHLDKLETLRGEVDWQYIRELYDLPAPVDSPLREASTITQSRKSRKKEPGSAARYWLARSPVCLDGQAGSSRCVWC